MQQRPGSPYPGGAPASLAGFVLGGVLAAGIVAVTARRVWLWRTGRSARFAVGDADVTAALGDSYLAVDRQGLMGLGEAALPGGGEPLTVHKGASDGQV